MSQTIGQKLAEVRARKEFSIEDVAHSTRIHPDTLRHLEADDYTSFANLTYAKSFLSMYAKHLEVDVSDYLEEFGPVGRSQGNGGPPPASGRVGSAGPVVFNALAGPERVNPAILFTAIVVAVMALSATYFLGKSHGHKNAGGDGAQEAGARSEAAAPDPLKNSSGPAVDEAPAAPARVESLGPPAPASSKPPTPNLPVPASEADGPVEIRRPAILEDDDSPPSTESPNSKPPGVRSFPTEDPENLAAPPAALSQPARPSED
ncbi:MAG: helix-turn-helix domain-containing protein [Verrucomicrobiales bacterium]